MRPGRVVDMPLHARQHGRVCESEVVRGLLLGTGGCQQDGQGDNAKSNGGSAIETGCSHLPSLFSI
jgi:hypothetical protein